MGGSGMRCDKIRIRQIQGLYDPPANELTDNYKHTNHLSNQLSKKVVYSSLYADDDVVVVVAGAILAFPDAFNLAPRCAVFNSCKISSLST